MKNTLLGNKEKAAAIQQPLKVKQALAAIELGKTDQAIFSYLKFISSILPIEQKTFVHVVSNMSLLTSFYQKTEDANISKYALKERLAEELLETVNQFFPSQPENNQIAILEGNPLEQLLGMATDIRADRRCCMNKLDRPPVILF